MPYWRLSSVYFFYFAVIGATAPFWGLYLHSLNFSSVEIGALAAVPLVIRIIMPNVWGKLADRSNKRVLLLRLGAVGATAFSVGLLWVKHVWGIAFFLAAYSVFWNAVLAQVETITMRCLGPRYALYGRVRLWGSVGFICTVIGLGVLFDGLSIDYLPAVICLVLSAVAMVSFTLPSSVDGAIETKVCKGFIPVLLTPDVAIFFGVMFLLQVSHGAYYVFFSIYLESIQYERIEIGMFWALGVLAEIILFVFMHKLLARFSLGDLLLVSLACTSLRWFLIPLFADVPVVLFTLQLLHAFTFGVAHAIAIEFCRRRFAPEMQSRGQAFYSSVCFGAGAALGAGFSGIAWQHGAQITFWVASSIVALGIVIAIRFLRGI